MFGIPPFPGFPEPDTFEVRPLFDSRSPEHRPAWSNRAAAESDCSHYVNAPTRLLDADTGELLALYLHLNTDPEAGPLLDDLADALPRIAYASSTRTSGLPTKSRIFGYRPRTAVRNNYCSATSLAGESPAEHALLTRAAGIVSGLYARFNPALYARHQFIARTRVLPEYRLSGDAYTSGIVNFNNPLKYHFDSGNFDGIWSGMLAFKVDIGGGFLALPELDVSFEIRDRSVLYFDGQAFLHGVTPIRLLSPTATRFTIVYYSLKEMWNCEPLAAEIERIQKRRTDIHRRRAVP